MDFAKNVLIWTIVAAMFIVPAEAINYDLEYADLFDDNNQYKYDLYPTYISSVDVANGETRGIIVYAKEDQPLVKTVPLKISTFTSGIVPKDTSQVRIQFADSQEQIYYLSNESTWLSNGYVYLNINLGSSYSNYTRHRASYLFNVTAVGQTLKISTYLPPDTSIAPGFYSTPSVPIYDMVQNTRNVVDIIFNLMDMMLIISVLLGVGFAMVFLWKLFEFVIAKIKLRGTDI